MTSTERSRKRRAILKQKHRCLCGAKPKRGLKTCAGCLKRGGERVKAWRAAQRVA
jgi:hypothetical protein